jgi:hypothetical protein
MQRLLNGAAQSWRYLIDVLLNGRLVAESSDRGRLSLGLLAHSGTALRIPTKRTTDSERMRPPIPIDGGQGFR